MIGKIKNSGIAIALAWPETYCKQAGAWYDFPLKWFGINQKHYYKVGHAAIVLINKKAKTSMYFDFGRYHAPYNMGRVRSEVTDPELALKVSPLFNLEGELLNLEQILQELATKKACHGNGDLHAAAVDIDYDSAIFKAKSLQKKSPIWYGPFVPGGTNCSRFVNTVLLAGVFNLSVKAKLLFPLTLTPSPLGNISAIGKKTVVKVPEKGSIPPVCNVKGTLLEPDKPTKVPASAQWLSGEGAGSWFHLNILEGNYIITRFDELGNVEFIQDFRSTNNLNFNPELPYRFVHLSHARGVKIYQKGLVHHLIQSPEPSLLEEVKKIFDSSL
jgi:hypothetical protein